MFNNYISQSTFNLGFPFRISQQNYLPGYRTEENMIKGQSHSSSESTGRRENWLSYGSLHGDACTIALDFARASPGEFFLLYFLYYDSALLEVN